MSEGFSKNMERAYYDERFMQEAARLVDSGLLRDWEASRSAQVDEAWLQNMTRSAKKTLKAHMARRRALSSLRRVGRGAAITILTAGLLLGGIYGTVEAAREPINNFFLAKRNPSHAIFVPSTVQNADQYLVPEGWDCPIYPTWIPDGYQLEHADILPGKTWYLVYTSGSDETDSIDIAIDSVANLGTMAVNTEGMDPISDSTIQGVPARIVQDTRVGVYVLTMVKNDYLIEISASTSVADVVRIAELFSF